MSSATTSRRRFLQLAAGTGIASRTLAAATLAPAEAAAGTVTASADATHAVPAVAAAIADGALRLEFDRTLRSRAWHVPQGQEQPGIALTGWAVTEYLLLADGGVADLFTLQHQERAPVDGREGRRPSAFDTRPPRRSSA